MQRVSLKPGLQFVPKRGDGNAFCMDGSIIARQPEIRIKFLDLSQLYNNFPQLFGQTATGGLQINIYLQAGASGGIRGARGSSSHYRIYAETGALDPDDISVQGSGDAEVELVLRVTSASLGLAALCTIPSDP